MAFNPGIDVRATTDPLGFQLGPGVFGPEVERRRLDSIRPSLRDPSCNGPDPVYAIVMDVGKDPHHEALKERKLLYGIVTYARGRLGREPVHSQGHIHCVSSHSGWAPAEVYEVWGGRAVVYMQEFVEDDPGRCFAVTAGPGEVVVVPPAWAHAALSIDPEQPLTFAAWCDREYGFNYDRVRAHRGMAWYAELDADGNVAWAPNPRYAPRRLFIGAPRNYHEWGLDASCPIYSQFEADPARFQWVSKPGQCERLWKDFVPCKTSVSVVSAERADR